MRQRKKGVKVSPTSIAKIRVSANYIRELFHLGSGKVNMINLIEFILPLVLPQFSCEILDPELMGEDEARTYPDKSHIQIRLDIYNAATDGDRRAQFTLAHELGHLIMHAGSRSRASFARGGGDHEIFEDSEWQADTFAAEFLMPWNRAKTCNSAEEISEMFEVSSSAAEVRYEKINYPEC